MSTNESSPTKYQRGFGDMSGETDPIKAFRERNARTPFHPDGKPQRDGKHTLLLVLASVATVAMVLAAVGVWQMKAAQERQAEEVAYNACLLGFGYATSWDAPWEVVEVCLDRAS